MLDVKRHSTIHLTNHKHCNISPVGSPHFSSSRVPIGKPIAKTQLMIDRESGLLVIQGRGCVTNFSNAHGDVTRTGDYVMRVDSRRRGEKPRIYVQGRVSTCG